MPALALLSMHTSPLAQPGTADAGGMNVYVRELATALARSGVRCEVYTRRERPDQPASVWVEPGFRAHYVSAGPCGPVRKDELPSLVGPWTEAVAEDLAQLAAAGQPVDLLHANYWLSAVAGHNLKHSLDLPLVCTFHTLERVKAQAGEGEAAVAPLREAGESSAIGCSDAIVASTPVEAAQLSDLYSADATRTVVIAPGVDHAFFSPGQQAQARRAVGLPTDVPIIVFVGRVQPLKGLTVAVEALAHLCGRAAQAHLVIIGGPSGPQGRLELDRARELLDTYGLAGRAHLVAPQPHERLSTYYRAADVCVVPSRSESFGLVALEAAACGLPVVASAVGGLPTLVDHGRTGYLVAPDDPSAFAYYLGEVINDRALARLLGAAAHARSAKFTWAAAAGKVSDLAGSLAGRELVSCG